MIIEKINLSFNDYFSRFENFRKPSNYIFRGQSNLFLNNKFYEWKLISSFNRSIQFKNLRFSSFLTQQLDKYLFDSYYKENKFVKDYNLENTDLLTKLYLLQHYGIPTCLIDFTKDPLVALYFAMSSLSSHNGGIYSLSGKPKFYPDSCGVSIFQINHKLLDEKFNFPIIQNDLGLNYWDNHLFETSTKKKRKVHLGMDLHPINKSCGPVNNFNLSKQEGVFILYDNFKNETYDLIDFLVDYSTENDIHFDQPLIKIYKIKYNDLFKPLKSRQPRIKSAFQILKEKRISGNFLFNDIQGLKYDMIFFNQQ